MRFSKWHALGNTYLLVERAETGTPLTTELARALCDAGRSDGVLEVLSATDDEATVLIWNPDGSLAEMSGNGTRIAAAWLGAAHGQVGRAGARRPAHGTRAHPGGRARRAGAGGGGGRPARDPRRLGRAARGDARLGREPSCRGAAAARSRRPPSPRPSPGAPPALPRPHERPARRGRGRAHPARVRLGARRGGDVVVGLERRRRRRGGGRARLVREPGHGAPPGRRAPGRAPGPSGTAHGPGGRASSRSRTRAARRSGSS